MLCAHPEAFTLHAVCASKMLLYSTPDLVAVTRMCKDQQLCRHCIHAALMARTNKLLLLNNHHLVDAVLTARTNNLLLSNAHRLVDAALMARTSDCEVMVVSLLNPCDRCSAGHTRRSLTNNKHVPNSCLIDAARTVLAYLRRIEIMCRTLVQLMPRRLFLPILDGTTGGTLL